MAANGYFQVVAEDGRMWLKILHRKKVKWIFRRRWL